MSAVFTDRRAYFLPPSFVFCLTASSHSTQSGWEHPVQVFDLTSLHCLSSMPLPLNTSILFSPSPNFCNFFSEICLYHFPTVWPYFLHLSISHQQQEFTPFFMQELALSANWALCHCNQWTEWRGITEFTDLPACLFIIVNCFHSVKSRLSRQCRHDSSPQCSRLSYFLPNDLSHSLSYSKFQNLKV